VEETDVPITQAMEVRKSEFVTFQSLILGFRVSCCLHRGGDRRAHDAPITQAVEVWHSELAIFSKCDFGGSGCHAASTLLTSSGALADACWLQHCTLLHVPLECTCGNQHTPLDHRMLWCWVGRAPMFLQQPQNPANP
jgi:hypothetical protein